MIKKLLPLLFVIVFLKDGTSYRYPTANRAFTDGPLIGPDDILKVERMYTTEGGDFLGIDEVRFEVVATFDLRLVSCWQIL